MTSYSDKPPHLQLHTPYILQNITVTMATLLTQETAAKSTHQAPTTTVYEKGLQVGDDVNRITKIETFRVRPRWLFVRVETSKVSVESLGRSDRPRSTIETTLINSKFTCALHVGDRRMGRSHPGRSLRSRRRRLCRL
jgi:hypothetical protein